MNPLTLLSILVCFTSFLEPSPIQEAHRSAEVYPLATHNKWSLVSGAYELSVTVDSTIRIDQSAVFVLTEKSHGTTAVTRRILFFSDKRGNVHRLTSMGGSLREDTTGMASVWYKFDARVGESWYAIASSQFNSTELHRYRITLQSKRDRINAAAGSFRRCYRFYIDDLSESDTEYSDWIAPGTGLVKRSYGRNLDTGFLLDSLILR